MERALVEAIVRHVSGERDLAGVAGRHMARRAIDQHGLRVLQPAHADQGGLGVAAHQGAVQGARAQLGDQVDHLRIGELDPARPVITLCHAGMRSLYAADALIKAGFTPASSEVAMVASTEAELDFETAEKLLRLVEHLEDLDDDGAPAQRIAVDVIREHLVWQ